MKQWIEIGEQYQPEAVYFNILKDEEVINREKGKIEMKWDHLFVNKQDYQELMKNFRENQVAILPVINDDETISKQYSLIEIQIKTKIKGEKIWLNDQVSHRPAAITVFLLANGKVIKEKKITKETAWNFSFTNLALYDEGGNKIDYTVKEQAVIGYQTTYENYTIRNIKKT